MVLGKPARTVLEYIKKVSDGTFKVLDADEILAQFTEDKPTKTVLGGIIKSLEEAEYVKVKSSSADMYCLAATSKARNENFERAITATESAAAGETEAKSLPQVKTAQRTATTVEISAIKNTLYRRAFFGAMLGAVTGGSIITALAILIISLM